MFSVPQSSFELAPDQREGRRLLVVLHQEQSTPGRVGHLLRQFGYHLDLRRPALGDPLPVPGQSDHVAAVVFGGPMSANDTDSYILDEIRFMEQALAADFPVLGICLGAQLMVKALGCSVYGRHDGQVEIGYYKIEPTAAGQSIIWWPPTIFEWHKEGFDLPPDATLLARTDLYPHQAFSIGRNSFAVQFHFELTLAMHHRWLVKGAERMHLPGAKPRSEHLNDRLQYDQTHIAWARDFLHMWTESILDSQDVSDHRGFG